MARALAVSVVALVCAGYAAGATSKEVAPFHYRYQVTSVTLTATFTKGTATATTELRLSARPKPTTLRWYGRKGAAAALPWNGANAIVIRMAGTVSYSGLDQAACNGTVTLDTSRWRPIYATLGVADSWNRTRAKLGASAGRFPIATIYPRRGGACENGALTWWQPGAIGVRPFRAVRGAGFSISTNHTETFDDGSALEWTARMSVRKVRYELVDCARTPWC